jgi:hypothetical protein
MCDYSLHNVMTRPAKVGDKLKTVIFSNTLTRGFAAVEEPKVAVCLLPGTEVAFEKEVEYDGLLPFFRRKAGAKIARFRQVNVDKPTVHHDAVEFPNGKIVLLTKLSRGQDARVLQLPASAGPLKETISSASGEDCLDVAHVAYGAGADRDRL